METFKKIKTIFEDEKNVNIKTIKSINQFVNITKTSAGQKINLVVLRNQKKLNISIIPRKKPPKNQGALGIVIRSYKIKKYPWYQAPFFGFIETSKVTLKIVQELSKGIIKLITFQKSQMQVTGPIGIAKYTNQAIKFGRNAVLEFTALLSLNLAVLNILPIPALDGGRLVFVIYEWVTKKQINKKLERSLNLIGLSILISLLILVSISDIIKLFR